MCASATRVCFVCLMIVAVGGPVSLGGTDFETQVKKVVVRDANGLLTPDVQVRRYATFTWDDRAGMARLTEAEPSCRTDAKGEFSFEFVRQGAGAFYVITDAAAEQMGSLCVGRQDPA